MRLFLALGLIIGVVLVIGNEYKTYVGQAEARAERMPPVYAERRRIERDALESLVVVTLPNGLICAVHDHYATAGTGLSCDWANWKVTAEKD